MQVDTHRPSPNSFEIKWAEQEYFQAFGLHLTTVNVNLALELYLGRD